MLETGRSSQTKQWCTPSCVLPLCRTTLCSLQQCLIWFEWRLRERIVLPVDLLLLLDLLKNSLNCLTNTSITIWLVVCLCLKLTSATVLWKSGKQHYLHLWNTIWEVVALVHVILGVVDSICHESVALIQIFPPKRSSFPKILQGKYIINHTTLLVWLDLLFTGTLI